MEADALCRSGACLISGPKGGRHAANTPTAASTDDQTAGGVPAECLLLLLTTVLWKAFAMNPNLRKLLDRSMSTMGRAAKCQ